jgi:ATP-dependent 26S proteasome regulatory subunit
MTELEIQQERATNLWNSASRKMPPLAKATQLRAAPAVGSEQIGGLVAAQDEVLTYACAATSPEKYEAWGTFPPTGLLLIGQAGSGKTLLAEALATRARTAFLRVHVPNLALEIVHRGGQVGELLEGWGQTLGEMPPTTVFFHELEFFQAEEIGGRRTDLPIGPIMDFLCELVDRTVASPKTLLVGSTSHPDTLRPAFVQPGRFERVVEVTPSYPDDVVAALRIHARAAEKRAGRTLFAAVDWADVVSRFREPSTGDWIHLLHAVLRRKASAECEPIDVPLVETDDFLAEVEIYRRTRKRLPRSAPSGTYL